MKILFETVNGKEVLKEFENGTLAKNFIVKNKDKLSKAKIMEGPLGSGGWTPKKAYHNFKKGHEKYKSFDSEMNVQDSFNNRIIDYISSILKEISKKEGGINRYVCGYNKHGLFIDTFFEGPALRDMNDPDEGSSRAVSFDSEKYKSKVYLPKLTQYVKEHKSLPSEKQLRKYLEDVISKRYENNLKKQKLKKPERFMSKTDVEDF